MRRLLQTFAFAALPVPEGEFGVNSRDAFEYCAAFLRDGRFPLPPSR